MDSKWKYICIMVCFVSLMASCTMVNLSGDELVKSKITECRRGD